MPKEATELREVHLHLRQDLIVGDNDAKRTKAIKNMRTTERRNRMYQTIRNINHPNLNNGGLSYILVPKEDGSLERIDDVTLMNEALFERNRKHFAQADGTPCTREPMISLIGTNGITESAKAILQGDYPEDIPDPIKFLFQALQDKVPQLDNKYPFHEMISGFGHWREQTTTSPSGKHLGIYKSLVVAHNFNIMADNEKESMNKLVLGEHTPTLMATKLLQIQCNIMNIAIQRTHPLQRWKLVHNFFIEKIPGKPLISKLRVIHIFEADYNLILKYFISKKTLRHAIHHNAVATEQAGGRPKRTAIDEAVRTVVTFETCQLQRKSGGVMYNDAAACFDRIIENVSNITCMNAGAPLNVLDLHAKTIESMQYIIKHKNGLSPKANGHLQPDPFYGVGQGAGDAGARWGFVSDMIIKAYNKHAHDATLTSPITKIFSNHKVQAFVDDSRLFLLFPDPTGTEILKFLSQDVQLWEQLNNVTGAKLELTKCKLIVFTWQFDTNGNAILVSMDNETPMEIIDSDTKQPIIVESITKSDAYKLLGVQIALDGNHNKQIEAIEEKANHVISVFTKADLSANDLVLGFNTIAIPTLYYPFPATTIPSKTLNRIQKKITNTILPKLGLNRTFPRAVLYAPKYFGGIGFNNMAVEQSIAHFKSIIGHFRAATSLSINYIQLLESYMIMSGLSQPPFENTTPLSYIQAPWIDVTRTFLHQNNATIIIPQLPTLPMLREFDTNIMEHAISQQLDPNHLNDIHKCRLYLQIHFISEMSDTSGDNILEYYYDPTLCHTVNNQTYSKSLHEWPQQQLPPARVWKIWKTFLQTLTQQNMKYALRDKLGRWNNTAHKYRKWHFQYQNQCIFDYSKYDPPVQWQIRDTKNTTTNFRLGNFEQSNPHTAKNIPVFPEILNDGLILKLPTRKPLHTLEICDPIHLDPFDHMIEYTHSVSPTSFTTMLSADTIQIYVGCHQRRSQLAIGWLIYANHKAIYQGKLRLHPTSNDTLIRGASQSILAAILHYNHEFTHNQCPIRKQQITIYTCNKQVHHRIIQHQKYQMTATKQFHAEHEAIAAICTYMKDFPGIKCEYIPMSKKTDQSIHQQRLGNSQQHAINATNMYSDKVELPYNYCTATLRINKMEIPTNLDNELRFTASTPELRDFFYNKYKWSSSTVELIDWQVHSNALNQQHPYSKKTITQFIHRWLPTHAHHGTKTDITTKCPICHIQEETNDHFLQCDNKKISDEWESQTQTLYDEMQCLGMDPILLFLLTKSITDWKTTRQPDMPSFIHIETYSTLFQEQNKIGWNQILYGRLTKTWVDIQNQHGEHNDNGIMIISKAIGKIFKIIYHIWKERCNTKYRKIDQPKYRTQILIPQVEALYDQQQHLDEAGRLYFERPMTNILEQKIQYIHQWLKKTKNIIQLSIDRTANTIAQNPRIHSFFPRIPTKTKIRNRGLRTTTIQVRNINITPQLGIRNIEQTRPRPPPHPDPGTTNNDLVDFLTQPP